MSTIVDKLSKKSFSRRTLAEKVRIVTENKTTPVSKSSTASTVLRRCGLDPIDYDQVEWLIVCDLTEEILCWPCLLFMPARKWKWRTGVSDMPFVSVKIKCHEKAPEHIESVCDLKLFIMENISKSTLVKNKIQHNKTVKRNRDILKLVIDAICFVTKRRTRGEKYECSLLKTEECVPFLQLLKKCRWLDIEMVDDAIALLHSSPKTMNDLVDAISMTVKAAIVNEAQKSNYASLIINDHGTNSDKSQISTVIRYVKHDKVCEKFIGFSNLVGSRWFDNNALANRILNIIKDYDISEKFVALSVDGVLLTEPEFEMFLKAFRCSFDFFYFIPSSAFGYALLHGLSIFGECNLFLKTLNSMEAFFEDDRRWKSLETFLFSRIPSCKTNNKWNNATLFVVFLSSYRKLFVEFFDLIDNESERWSPGEVVKAAAFRNYLQELHTVFLLKTFQKVFLGHFDRNFKIKMESNPDAIFSFSYETLFRFRNEVLKLRDINGFADVWLEVTVETVNIEASKSEKLKVLNDPMKTVYAELFKRIMNHLIQQIEIRYEDLKRLVFCDMFSYNYAGLPNFKKSLVQKMQVEYGPLLDKTELHSDIIAFKGNFSLFTHKSMYELLRKFVEYNFKEIFPQLYKLTEFILTLPLLPSSELQDTPPKLKYIRNFSYIPQCEEIPSGEISVLCLEKEMVQELKCSSEHFYDDVLLKFMEVNEEINIKQV